MRKTFVPKVFVPLVSLGAVLPVYTSPSDVIVHTEKSCAFE